ncbi:MAG: SurA N-terminal domain-containing protein [Myxococcota bacterium]
MSRALIALLVAIAASARADLVDRVVAFVDDEAILLSEVRERAQPMLHAQDGDPHAVYRQVLEELIDHQLVAREAEQLRVWVTDEEVRSALDRLMEEGHYDQSQWLEALENQGWTAPLYETVLREQILRLKVLQYLTQARETVSEDEVRAEWERRAQTFEREERFRVAELSQLVADGADPEAQARARGQLQARVASVRDGTKTMLEAGGIEIGWVLASELGEPVRVMLSSLDVGAVSPVQATSHGFTVIQLLERATTEPAHFESQAESIRAELLEARHEQAVHAVMQSLRSNALIRRL